MWRERIIEWSAECEFNAGISQESLAEAEANLGVRFPDDLAALLKETNGVYYRYAYQQIIWKVEHIVERNLEIRADKKLAENYMTFECLLFFAHAGVDGIQFAFPITANGIVRQDRVIAWYPIEDSRPVVCFSLADYLQRWLQGGLTL
jgi:hypothetical protein